MNGVLCYKFVAYLDAPLKWKRDFLWLEDAIAERLKTHINDPRFRGVYFLLATLLPLDAAQQLREDLIQYAAEPRITQLAIPLSSYCGLERWLE
jgi:hypothetical protein